MEVRVKLEAMEKGNVEVIAVHGRIDTLTAPEFEQFMRDRLEQGQYRLVLDLVDLEYISSAGLRSLLVTAKKAKAQGGFLVCCGLQEMVNRVFEVSGFSQVIPVYASVEEAVAAS